MNRKSKKLALLALSVITSMGMVSVVHGAEEPGAESGGRTAAARSSSGESMETHRLSGITVEGEQDALPGGLLKASGHIGLLGQMDVMDTPFTVTTINQTALETFATPVNGISDALSVVPSVRADSGGTYSAVSIRGLYQTGAAFYVNGIPGMLCNERVPYYWVQDVTVISGPNIGVNGTSYNEAVAGTVNLHSKVASPGGNAEVKLAYVGGSAFEEGFDVGTRFGENDEFGIRVIGNNRNGETDVKDFKLEQQQFMVNLDHQGERSKTNLLFGYDHTYMEGPPGAFSFSSAVTQLPSAPDAGKIYKPDWSYDEYDNWVLALNHEQKITDHLSVFLNAGYHREDWYEYINGSPTIINNSGDFTVRFSNYPFTYETKYLGLGVRGDFTIGSVKNEYIIGVDKNWFDSDVGRNANWSWSGTGNIYQDNSWANPGTAHIEPADNLYAKMDGWYVIDTLKAVDDRLQMTLGVHGHRVKRQSVGSDEQISDAVSPTVAVSYKITPDLMVYADHTESFGYGTIVSSTQGYANGGDMLDPTKTKQRELGFKLKTGNFYHTLTYFHIRQANTADVYEDGLKYLRIDGAQRNKGIEWGFTGNLGGKWDLLGGLMYLDSKDDEGKRVNGAARWSGSLAAVYHPNERWSLIGRAVYMGSASINDGVLDVPAYVRYDLGATFKTKISNTPVTISAMCYNVADGDYYLARSGQNSLYLESPRTFSLAATFSM